MAAIGIFFIAFVQNVFIGKMGVKFYKKYQEAKDKRVNVTTETLNNIKMVKTYSLQDIFFSKIQDKRKDELSIQWKRFMLGAYNITNFYLYPQLLSAAVFSFYIGSG